MWDVEHIRAPDDCTVDSSIRGAGRRAGDSWPSDLELGFRVHGPWFWDPDKGVLLQKNNINEPFARVTILLKAVFCAPP